VDTVMLCPKRNYRIFKHDQKMAGALICGFQPRQTLLTFITEKIASALSKRWSATLGFIR
jgi:hypothetical protein